MRSSCEQSNELRDTRGEVRTGDLTSSLTHPPTMTPLTTACRVDISLSSAWEPASELRFRNLTYSIGRDATVTRSGAC